MQRAESDNFNTIKEATAANHFSGLRKSNPNKGNEFDAEIVEKSNPSKQRRWTLREFRKRKKQYFERKAKQNNCTPTEAEKATVGVLTFYAFSITAMIFCGRQWMQYGSWYYSILFGISIWFGSTMIMHDAMHCAIGEIYGFDLSYILITLFGWLHCIPLAWYLQHMKSHHPYTNQKQDVDIWHWEFYFFRVSKLTTRRPHGKLGFVVALFFIFLTTLFPSIGQTIIIWCTGKYDKHQPYFNVTKRQYLESFFHMIALLGMLLFGIVKHGFWSTILIYYTHGLIYFAFSQVSHVNEESELSEHGTQEMNHFQKHGTPPFGRSYQLD